MLLYWWKNNVYIINFSHVDIKQHGGMSDIKWEHSSQIHLTKSLPLKTKLQVSNEQHLPLVKAAHNSKG